VEEPGEFARWYGATYAGWVRALSLMTRDVELASDVAREAFARAYARCDRVARSAIGRRCVRSSTSLVQYLAVTNFAVLKGEQALVEASDLTGAACGPRLYDSAAQNIST
jgi:hypothetical protein